MIEGDAVNPRCDAGRTCPTDRTYVCASGECLIAAEQPCERTSQCQEDAECAATSGGGKTCHPTERSVTIDAEGNVKFEPITPILSVEIPGADPLSPATKEGNEVIVPFLAQYINAMYRYGVSVVLIFAIVMVVYGGFRYLVGASIGDIQAGKKIIIDALMGMLVVLGAYMILNTVNPDTVNFNALRLAFVENEGLELIPESDYQSATGRAIPTKAEVTALVSEIAQEFRVNECGLNAVTIGESGGNANAIGYDSNVPRVGVFSRRAFIRSGVRYSKSTFPVPPGEWTGSECRPGSSSLNAAQIAAIQDGSIRNNARFNPNAPPDYGIDDRFSIGIGLGQVTLLPESSTCKLPRCPDGTLGRTIQGRCYTVPELLEPRTQMLASASIYKRAYDGCDEYHDPYIRQRCTFARYGGTGCSVRIGACRKMKLWATCQSVPPREVDDCRGYWLSKEDDYCNDMNNN
ncbi:MAG: pilin [Patescibacteria group bacterium]